MEEAVTPAYERIGVGYDGTRRADPGLVARLAALLEVAPGLRCLDVGCGTGNYTTALAGRGGRWTGLDISVRMLTEARTKPGPVDWALGDAHALPFATKAFGRAMCTLAIHHFVDLAAVFTELARVLGRGRLVIFTSAPSQMRGYWVNEYFPEAMRRSMVVMPEIDDIERLLAGAGFAAVRTEGWYVPPDLQDLFLYSGKHDPELYLSPVVRRAISTFSQHADAAEVKAGCARLAADIASGRIGEVQRAYTNPHGDYAFVVADR